MGTAILGALVRIPAERYLLRLTLARHIS